MNTRKIRRGRFAFVDIGNGSDAKSRQVALINFRFKQLKMASRKIMPSITVYFKTSEFNQETVMH